MNGTKQMTAIKAVQSWTWVPRGAREASQRRGPGLSWLLVRIVKAEARGDGRVSVQIPGWAAFPHGGVREA